MWWCVYLLASLVLEGLDGCIHLCLPLLPFLIIFAVRQEPVPGKGAVAPVVAATGKALPYLQVATKLALRGN